MYLESDFSAKEVAEMAGIHEDTLYLWKKKYVEDGELALLEKSKAPLSHPNEYSDEIKELMVKLRHEGLKHEKRYLGPKVLRQRLLKQYGIKISASGIGKFLNREGLLPEKNKRRRPKKERIKKCKIHEPGELLGLDVKYAVKSFAGHWFYEYDAIDYATGVAQGAIYEIQSNFESILFLKTLLKKAPFSIKGIQTDNGSIFTNYYTGYKKSANPSNPRRHPFDLACLESGIKHYLIDPGKPAQNGKIERFHRTVEEEFYQTNTFTDLNSLRKKFRDYLYYYNNEREHSSIEFLTPLEKLKTFAQYEKIRAMIN